MKTICCVSVALIVMACSSPEGTRAATDSTGTDVSDGTDGTVGTTASDGLTAGSGSNTGGGGDCPNAAEFNDQLCNPYCAASGCASGQFCSLNGTQLGCVDVGTQALGKGCNEDSPCAEGMCVIEDGKSVGKCRAFCVEDSDCTSSQACLLQYKYGQGDDSLGVCDVKPPQCSVFEQNCESGQGCYLQGCMAPGALGIGEACSAPNDCKPGLLCISEKCQEVCNPKSGGPDPKCHLKCPNNTASIQGEDDVGICSIEDDKPQCDLINPACDPGLACYFDPGVGGICDTPGTGAVGDSCSQPNSCQAGLVCWANKCKRICADPGTPGPHTECEDQFSPCGKLTSNAGYCDE